MTDHFVFSSKTSLSGIFIKPGRIDVAKGGRLIGVDYCGDPKRAVEILKRNLERACVVLDQLEAETLEAAQAYG